MNGGSPPDGTEGTARGRAADDLSYHLSAISTAVLQLTSASGWEMACEHVPISSLPEVTCAGAGDDGDVQTGESGGRNFFDSFAEQCLDPTRYYPSASRVEEGKTPGQPNPAESPVDIGAVASEISLCPFDQSYGGAPGTVDLESGEPQADEVPIPWRDPDLSVGFAAPDPPETVSQYDSAPPDQWDSVAAVLELQEVSGAIELDGTFAGQLPDPPPCNRLTADLRPLSPDDALSAILAPAGSPYVAVLTAAVLAATATALSWGAFYNALGTKEPGRGGKVAISAVVERIISVESDGDANARNKRSSATGAAQFLDATWLELIRAHRPDLAAKHNEKEILELRRDAKLAREITARFMEKNAALLSKRGLPVTPGTLYLTHFAGPAGAVAILSVADDADAASLMARADTTGKMTREKIVSANPFLAGFTVADLKGWADRKMRGLDRP